MILKVGKYASDQLPLSEYHTDTAAVSKTDLDNIHRSYEHYLYTKKAGSVSTPSLIEGAALHCLVLTPDQFKNNFTIMPKLNRRTLEGRKYYESLVAKGKPIVPATLFERIEAMAASILTNPTSKELLQEGTAETSFVWVDTDTGVLCKCRTDYLRRLLIMDIKTCQDASYYDFQRSVIDHRYHVQGAYFVDGLRATDGQERDFILIAVEKTAPYAVAVYKMDEVLLERGRLEYKEDLKRYVTHSKNPELWPGYELGVVEMTLPRWATRNQPNTTVISPGVLI